MLCHRNLFLCQSNGAADRTFLTSLQAGRSTGSLHGRNNYFRVGQLGKHGGIAAQFLIANIALNHSVVATCSLAGCFNSVFLGGGTGNMTLGSNGSGHTGKFFGTSRTVDHGIVAAVGGTGSCNLIFDHSFTGGMAGGRDRIGRGSQYLITNGTADNRIIAAFFRASGSLMVLLLGFTAGMLLLQGLRLGLDHVAANGAVAAFGQTGSGTGRLHSLIHHRSMARGGDHSLFRLPILTDRALLTIGQTGLGTGGSLARDGFIIMAGSGYSSGLTGKLRGTSCTVDHCVIAAVSFTGDLLLVFGHRITCVVAGSGDLNTFRNAATALTYIVAVTSYSTVGLVVDDQFTVGMPQSGDHGLNDLMITAGASCTIGQAILGTGGGLTGSRGQIMAQGRDFFHLRRIQGIALSIHTAAGRGLGAGFRTGGFLGHSGGIQALASRNVPHTVGIEVGTSSIGCSFQVGTVHILQLGRGDRNLVIPSTLDKLIMDLLSAGLHHKLCSLSADNGGTTLGSIDIARRYIHKALNNNRCISHVLNGAGKFLAGSIRDFDYWLVGRATIVAPFRSIINIEIDAVSQSAASSLINNDLGTGQQGNVLGQGDGTTVDLHGDIAVDAQVIVRRVDTGGAYFHRNRRDRQVTVGIHQ